MLFGLACTINGLEACKSPLSQPSFSFRDLSLDVDWNDPNELNDRATGRGDEVRELVLGMESNEGRRRWNSPSIDGEPSPMEIALSTGDSASFSDMAGMLGLGDCGITVP